MSTMPTTTQTTHFKTLTERLRAAWILTLASLFLALLLPENVRADEAGRDFHATLEGLLNDWEIELRLGTLPRIPSELQLRPPELSPSLPPSFAVHLEQLLAQRAMKAIPSRVTLKENQRAHRQAAPQRKDDALGSGSAELQSRLFYSPQGMLLTLSLLDDESHAVTWTRTYSSEVPRLQLRTPAETEPAEEYVPKTENHVLGLFTVEPTAEGSVTCLGVGWRSMRRFWNRKAEWGFEGDFLRETGTLLGTTPPPGNLYSTYHVGLLVMSTWNFIGGIDDPNRFRLALNLGLGGAFASGILSAHARSALEVRIAGSTALSAIAGYRPKGASLLGTSLINPIGGLEWGLGIHYLF